MYNSYYDVAQICENGHVINSMARGYPNSNQDYCDKCGAPTLMACPSCQTAIRGDYHVPGVISFSDYRVPSFCYKCGEPFPWTAAALRAAEELAEELEGLTDDERESLKKSLNELVRETPNTRVAETRFKRIMKKVGKDGYESMRSILTDIVSETVRKTIFGT
jgi:hypothetical protein